MASLTDTSSPFLILDKYPHSTAETAVIFTKVLLKEGLWHGEWHNVLNFGRMFGSRNIPQGLLTGLRQNKVPFSHNDFSSPRVDTVCVIKDVRALRWALDHKRSGKIKNLVVGPFIATLPHEYDEILLSPEIDTLLFLSEWHRSLFLRESRIPLKNTRIWFAGVDTEFWHDLGTPKDQVLVYNKIQKRDPYSLITDHLKAIQQKFTVLEYGKFTPDQFRTEINRSHFVIFLHESETQGLVTLETWACNVPSLHLDPGTMNFMGKKYPGAQTCPYLTPQTGMKFNKGEEFEISFQEMQNRLSSFGPRKVVLDRFTLSLSAENFVNILNELTHGKTGHTTRANENAPQL